MSIKENLYYTLKRILLTEPIKQGLLLISEKTKVHQLLVEMKMKQRDELRVFNELDGEWQATVININHAYQDPFIELEVHSQIRPPETRSGVAIAFALIKPRMLRPLIARATEVGADSFIPIISKRCLVHDFDLNELENYVLKAAERSERMTVPKIMPLCYLEDFPKIYSSQQIVFCNEMEHDNPISSLRSKYPTEDKIILIGPERGFTDKERDMLMSFPNVHSVLLTRNVLRSDTATIVAMSILI